MTKPCTPSQIRNPSTGRCVSKTGAIGKKLLESNKPEAPKTKKKSCPDDKIKNPATGRCVSKTGALGKKLLELKKPEIPKTLKETGPIVEKNKKQVKPQTPERKGGKYYDIKEGVMKYKELRPREIENNPSILNKYTNYYVSEKYDGWQAVWNGKDKFTTNTGKRTFKPPKEWSKLLPQGISIAGELIIKGKQATDVASLTTKKGEWDKVRFMAFDIPGMKNENFSYRTNELKLIVNEQCRSIPTCPMIYVEQKIYKSGNDIYKKWKSILESSGEGLVLTDPDSKYKPMKRSNDRVKLKGREDTEAVVEGFNVTNGKLKSIILKLKNNKTFNLGIGFSNDERKTYKKLFKIGQYVKFSYRSLSTDGKPKEARFVGKRHKADLL